MSDVREPSYPSIHPSRVRATLRDQLIDAGVLRPDRNETRAPSPWDRLLVAHIPNWMPVLRLVRSEELH